MHTTIPDRNLYWLFERILHAARPADEYLVDVKHAFIGGRRVTTRMTYGPDDKLSIQWGTYDAIINATWYPGRPDHASDQQNHDRRFVKLHFDPLEHAIYVVTCFGDRTYHAVGVAGAFKPNKDSFDPSNPDHLQRYVVPDEDAVFHMILGFIDEAYSKFAREAAMATTPANR